MKNWNNIYYFLTQRVGRTVAYSSDKDALLVERLPHPIRGGWFKILNKFQATILLIGACTPLFILIIISNFNPSLKLSFMLTFFACFILYVTLFFMVIGRVSHNVDLEDEWVLAYLCTHPKTQTQMFQWYKEGRVFNQSFILKCLSKNLKDQFKAQLKIEEHMSSMTRMVRLTQLYNERDMFRFYQIAFPGDEMEALCAQERMTERMPDAVCLPKVRARL